MNITNKTLGAVVDIRFTIKHAIGEDDLQREYGGSMKQFVCGLFDDEGIFGVVEDSYEVLEARGVSDE